MTPLKYSSPEAEKTGQRYLDTAESAPLSQGRNFFVNHIKSGSILTARQAIIANCAHCMGFYADGREDCGSEWCPSYRWMPYGKIKRNKKQNHE